MPAELAVQIHRLLPDFDSHLQLHEAKYPRENRKAPLKILLFKYPDVQLCLAKTSRSLPALFRRV